MIHNTIKKISTWIIFSLVLCSQNAHAESKFEKFKAAFKEKKTSSGKYNLSKKIVDLDVVLSSNGNYEFNSEKVIFFQEKPFKTSLTYEMKKLGEEKEILGKYLICFLDLNIECLKKSLSITIVETENQWLLEARPLNPNSNLAKIIDKVKIAGDSLRLKSLEIFEMNQNHTAYIFN